MATGVLAYITEILRSGKNLIFSDGTTNRLPGAIESTLPAAIGRGVKGGTAALSPDGVPVDADGNPMARIGTVAGTAADAKAVEDGLAAKAPLASPTFTGSPKAPTAAAGTNTTQVATTAFVTAAVGTATAVPGTVVERRYANGVWPVRGTLPAGLVVEWVGPDFPPLDGDYAVRGVDRYEASAS